MKHLRAPLAAGLPRHRWLHVLLWCTVAAGVALRWWQWRAGLAFWGDEILLMANVTHYSGWRLFAGPLDAVQGNLQAAPPAFLCWVEAMSRWVGVPTSAAPWSGERWYRLWPMVCACATLVLFARVATVRLGLAAGATLVLTVAGSDELIYQSANLKQYSSDVLAAAILLSVLGDPAHVTRRRWWALTATGTSLVWASHTAVFVWMCAAVAAIWGMGGRRGRAVSLMTGAACVLGSFTAMYLLSARGQDGQILKRFWMANGGFPDYASTANVAGFMARMPMAVFERVNKPVSWWLVVPAAVGAVRLIRTGRMPLLCAWVGPAVVNFALAMTHVYPMAGSRICLYLLPGLLLTVGAALVPVVQVGDDVTPPRMRTLWRAGRGLMWAIVLVVGVLGMVGGLTRMAGQPACRGQLGKASCRIARETGVDSAVWVATPTGRLEALFYAPSLRVEVLFPSGEAVEASEAIESMDQLGPTHGSRPLLRGYVPGKPESGPGGAALKALQSRFEMHKAWDGLGYDAWRPRAPAESR